MKYTKRIFLLIFIIILQNVFMIFVVNGSIINRFEFISYNYPIFMSFSIAILGGTSIYIIFSLGKIINNDIDNIKKINSSQEIIDALRAQKHDFNNHLSVISGLLQLKKYDNAKEYIFKINGSIDKVFKISNFKNVEFAALIHTKVAIAESKGIKVELDSDSTLENIKIGTVDLCKIFFNLFDNAVHELEKSTEEEKILTIEIGEYDNQNILSVCNSYPILDEKQFEKIFSKGYSTKIGQGRGYGLYIVKDIVKKNKGRIEVESYKNVGTIFTVFLPTNKKTA